MKKFWNWIRNDGGGRILRLEGPIDEDDFWGDAVTPRAFRDELEADTGDITVWVNSPGGSVFAAAEIYTMLRDYAGTVTVKVASVAASAASVVVMAGDVVQMSPTALLFLHDPSTIAFGNTRDMEKAIQTLDKVKESIISAYMAKSGLSHNRIAKLMENESWIPAKEAVQLGFADEILFDEKKPDDPGEPDEDESTNPDEDEDSGGGNPQEDDPDKTVTLDGLASRLYSSRRMGLAILNRLSVNAPAEKPEHTLDGAVTPPPVLGMDGKTADGSMPYELLKKQLDFLR